MNKNENKELNKIAQFIEKNKKDLIVYFGFIIVLLLLIAVAVIPQKEALTNTIAYSNVAIKVSSLTIAWYAIFILSGIVMASIAASIEFKRIGWNPDDLIDGILIIAPLAILGARLYYVLFDPSGKPDSLLDVFAIWEGGLAIHGAIIVATIGIIIFSRIKKLNVWVLADILAVGLLIGQIAGRWGNFMNAEAHGGVTSNRTIISLLPNFIKYQMQFSSYAGNNLVNSGSIYQPTFLYESLWNFILLSFFFIVRRKKIFKTGDMIGMYLIWYGIGRGAIIEPLRTDQLKAILGIPVNILLSYVLFVGGGIILLIMKRVYNKNEQYYYDLLLENKND